MLGSMGLAGDGIRKGINNVAPNGFMSKLSDAVHGRWENLKEDTHLDLNSKPKTELSINEQLNQQLDLKNTNKTLETLDNADIMNYKQNYNGEEAVKYYRVQTSGKSGSMERMFVNSDGSIKITTPDASLNLSYETPAHAQYFKEQKGGKSYIIELEVDNWFHDMVKEYSIPQKNYKTNPLNQGGTAPKIVDPSTPGNSVEFPSIWNRWFEEYARNARILE